MANPDWPKTYDCPSHVRHVPHTNNCGLPFWRKRNIPKRHQQPPHPSRRHMGQPPMLLRLDSAGESVEEYPHSSPGPSVGGRSGRPNRTPPSSNSFLGNIWSKVGYPLQSSHSCSYLAKPCTSPQSDKKLDRLVEKFSSACEMEQSQSAQNRMASNECQQPMMQPAMGVPPMTFNGGPYITWSSQDNSPRTFPAYYRFLNFLHFHPYNNATRLNRPYSSSFSQPNHHWNDIAQFQQHLPKRPNNPSKTHHMSSYCARKTNQQRDFQQLCGRNSKSNGSRMMQNKPAMSHHQGHGGSTTMPPTSSHNAADASKDHTKHFEKRRLKTGSAVKSEPSSQLESIATLPKDSCRQSKVHLYAMPCASLSDAMSTKACAYSEPDKVPSYQEGHEFKRTKTNENARSEKRQNCSQSTEQKVCNNRTTASNVTANVSTKPQNEPTENVPANEPTDASSSSKEMHSSVAYLLGNYVDNSAVCSNDSDFSEEEDDELGDDLDDASRELLESFQSDDPYNPMYGWKCLTTNSAASCKNTLTKQKPSDTGDSAVTFNDSGLSVVEVGSSESSPSEDPEDSEDGFTSSSDEWSDSGCDEEEEQKIWDSLNQCSDPYDPMGGWRLKASSASSIQKSNNMQEFDVTDSAPKDVASLRNSLQPLPLHNISDKPLPLHEISAKSSSKKHPSVSFILGADDSDSSSPDDSNNDETNDSIIDSSTNYEDIWESFQSSSDPYDPLNGWQCRSPSSLHRSASSPSELCKAEKDEEYETTPLKSPPSSSVDSPDCGQLQTPTANVSLIQSSSTGCLKTVWKKALQRDKERKTKKVSFCTHEPVVISPEVPMWEQEYVEARRGHWEELARDRCRFQRRIRQAEFSIAPCFMQTHRVKIYQMLFS